jgi:membrane protein YdbS with pleckstrin-like domain
MTPEPPPVEMRALHPGVQRAWRYANMITSAFALGGGLAAEMIFLRGVEAYPLPLGVAAASLTALVFVLGQLVVRRQFAAWRYALRVFDVVVEFGVVWRTRRCIPRVRVQHVDVHSGPVDRALGLVKLSIFTAGSVGAVVTIPGLSPEDADALKNDLLGLSRPS